MNYVIIKHGWCYHQFAILETIEYKLANLVVDSRIKGLKFDKIEYVLNRSSTNEEIRLVFVKVPKKRVNHFIDLLKRLDTLNSIGKYSKQYLDIKQNVACAVFDVMAKYETGISQFKKILDELGTNTM